jgi:Ca2+-binding EF-hand superfamily protein
MKEHLILSRGWSDSIYLDIICGLGSGVVSCVFMNPVDVARTRYYNQKYVNGKGVTYSSGMNAIQKIFRKEGILAFYTGFTSHFLRIGPHFVLTFLFLGMLRRSLADIYSRQDLKDSFQLFDKDADGVIDDDELSGLIKLILSKSPHDFGSDPKEHEKIMNIYKSRIMSKADLNGDGVIDINEYAIVESELKSIYKERKTAGNNL